ncbi:MAG: hypothetical protein JSV10_01645 [Candidatus Zixiibacteriota bacterium]|nr:MAG: hypothetical protein JSV10_01645 [candidate division Zixibacteria bacterium]
MEGKIDHSGFGAAVLKVCEIQGETGLFFGGRGGWVLNHTVVVGAGIYGLINRIKAKGIGPAGRHELSVTLTCLEFEYVVNSPKLIHYSFYAGIGGGNVEYIDVQRHFDYDYDATDAFFVAEPGANVILNVTTFFRLAVGASYRFVSGVEKEGLRNSDFDGPSANLTLKFGKF